jgi:hypothetical protein
MRTWNGESEGQGPSREGEEYSRGLRVQQGVFWGGGGVLESANAQEISPLGRF